MLEAKTSLERACLGEAPDNKATLPDFLTPLITLKILESFMKGSLIKIRAYFIEMKQSGVTLSYNNPQILMGLHELKLDDIKKEILKENKLDQYEDPANKIFQYAVQKYSQENTDGFNRKLRDLEMQHQRALDALMRDPEGATAQIESLGNHLKTKNLNFITNKSDLMSQSKSDDESGALPRSMPDIKSLKRQISMEYEHSVKEKDSKDTQAFTNNIMKILNTYMAQGSVEDLFKKENDINEVDEEEDEGLLFPNKREENKEEIKKVENQPNDNIPEKQVEVESKQQAELPSENVDEAPKEEGHNESEN